MLKLYLVRHGENRANLTKELSSRLVDYPLTGKGRLQAEQTGAHLRSFEIQAVYTSPLLRARETAEIIAGHLGLEVIVCEHFRELDVGDLERDPASPGSWRIHHQVIQDWMDGDPGSRFPGGENWYEARDRMRLGIEYVMNGREQGVILIVGHGGLFTSTIHDLCPDVDFRRLWASPTHNCGISQVEMRRQDGHWRGRLLRWSDISHLSGEAANLVPGLPDR